MQDCKLGFRWNAFWLGFHDGRARFFEMGITYPCQLCNEWYDRGVNLARWLFQREAARP